MGICMRVGRGCFRWRGVLRRYKGKEDLIWIKINFKGKIIIKDKQ